MTPFQAFLLGVWTGAVIVGLAFVYRWNRRNPVKPEDRDEDASDKQTW